VCSERKTSFRGNSPYNPWVHHPEGLILETAPPYTQLLWPRITVTRNFAVIEIPTVVLGYISSFQHVPPLIKGILAAS
jgi:hypothetical protein